MSFRLIVRNFRGLANVAFRDESACVLGAEPSTPVYRELQARTDKALRLPAGRLDAHVRVGALDRRLEADGRRDRLERSDKLVLAPLTRPADPGETFREGLGLAMVLGP